MKLRAMRVLIALVGSAIGLWIAAILLDDLEIDGAAFVIAVVLFTVITAILDPLVAKGAERYAEAFQSGSALVSTAVALWLTDLLSDGLSIVGIGTFLLATIIVWASTRLLSVLLTRFVLRRYMPG